jgi:acetyl-CoA carboxylase carboxyl transferase subunit alpha
MAGSRTGAKTMADRRKETRTSSRAIYDILPFERQIADLEAKIDELESLSKDSSLNLNGQIDSLKALLQARVEEVFKELNPWEKVQVSRAQGRPLSSDYVAGMCEEFMELHGDRLFRDDQAVLSGIGTVGGHRVMVVAHRKGRDTREKIACNFGSAHPEGYRKALRKMRLAEKFGLPIIALINTPGAYPGIGAEERGQAWAIAENLQAMFNLRVPVICVVIGEGGSGGALGIGIGDRILILEHAYYSVISPEGCAAILWRDRNRASEAAAALKLNAQDLLRFGLVDEVIAEPVGAAHRNPSAMVASVKSALIRNLEELKSIPTQLLLTQRYEKFRAMGSEFLEFQDEAIQEIAGDEAGEPDTTD